MTVRWETRAVEVRIDKSGENPMRRNNDDTGNVPHTYRAFTSNREDALWLCETLLPGAEYQLTNLYGVTVFRVPLNGGENQPWCEGRREDGNMPLTILIALLRALEAQEQSG